ncbi:MAG: hypothetical protein HY048_09180 [Acidobacteria bacterium]|nr:hypothetical protein [Acidobacteriota bacterium]
MKPSPILILAAALTFTFHAFADQGASGPTPAGEAELRVGRAAFQKVCAECHGSKGRGDGEQAKKLGFAPRNFTLGAFKCSGRTTSSSVASSNAGTTTAMYFGPCERA